LRRCGSSGLGIAGAVLVLGLPGRIAIARHHPEAEAVYLMGWVGFLAIVPWIQAFIWAFKPSVEAPYPARLRNLLSSSASLIGRAIVSRDWVTWISNRQPSVVWTVTIAE
jgi:hypothetical protein